MRAGNNIKEAKYHNHVIQEPFFKSLFLSQVFLYAYLLKSTMSVNCWCRYAPWTWVGCLHKVELANFQGCDSGPSYECYSTAVHKLTDTKDKLGLVVLEQLVTFTAATSADASRNTLVNSLASQVARKKKYYVIKHHQITNISLMYMISK